MITATLLKNLAGVGAGTLLIMSAPPAGAQVAVDTLTVTVLDNAGEIAPEDEDFLRTDTPKIDLPAEVRAVRYITFAENSTNLNDDVEELLRAEHQDWIQTDSFAPGELIIAVGFDPREVGTYGGNDVAAATGFAETARLDAINDSMKPFLQDGRIALGMLEGVRSVSDPTVISQPSQPPSAGVLWAIFGSLGAVIAAVIAAFVGVGRKQQAKQARERFDYAQKHYGEVAQQLDGINIRAHSLTSPLADDELRRQWTDVHSRFLQVNEIFGNFGELRHDSRDRDFIRHAGEIERAHTALTQMETAQGNIDTLYDMEHGDSGVRRRELTRLREDMQSARHDINDRDSAVDATLAELTRRTGLLSPDDPAFMDSYARLIRDYGVALRGVEKLLDDVKQSTERTTPAIYDNDWRVGTGYHAFVPYYMISTWHAADVSAAAASSSAGSSNTSFSSGFSGAGGSSGW